MKKNIILFAVIFCLFSGVKAFSQCIVSGGNLKKPIEYTTIEAIQKDAKKLLKAARKGDLEMKFPVGSSFRNEQDFRKIFVSSYFDWKNRVGKYREYFGNGSSLSECIDLSNEKQVDIYFYIGPAGSNEYPTLTIREVIGLMSPDQLSIIKDEQERILKEEKEEINANKKAGYGEVTNAGRDELIAKITALKTEYDEKILKVITEIESQEGYKNLVDKAKSYETKKEFAYALYCYKQVDNELFVKTEKLLSEYKTKRDDIITAANISNLYRDNQYKKIELENEKKAGQAAGKYDELKSLIEAGHPGKGEFNEFALYDEWKNLLMNAEKFGTEYGRYTFTISKLTKKSVDMKTRTATYTASIKTKTSELYKQVIDIIRNGYEKARTEDWKDLPAADYWPMISVSGLSSKSNLVNGVAVYRTTNSEQGYKEGDLVRLAYGMELGMVKRGESKINIMEKALGKPSQTVVYNAFACEKAGGAEFSYNNQKCSLYSTLYDLQFNIVDENGKELVKPKRVLLNSGMSFLQYNDRFGVYLEVPMNLEESNIEFSGISQDIMNKIENGTAKLNLLNVYLEYGTYNKADDTIATTGNQRDFMKNFPEIKLSLDKVDFEYMTE